MPLETLLLGYVVVLLAALSVLALYSAQRQRRFGPAPSADRVFRCEQCGFVYTDDADVDRSHCPQCRTVNEPFAF